jgi:hypothetical protein
MENSQRGRKKFFAYSALMETVSGGWLLGLGCCLAHDEVSARIFAANDFESKHEGAKILSLAALEIPTMEIN